MRKSEHEVRVNIFGTRFQCWKNWHFDRGTRARAENSRLAKNAENSGTTRAVFQLDIYKNFH